jgi:hypothetical protein
MGDRLTQLAYLHDHVELVVFQLLHDSLICRAVLTRVNADYGGEPIVEEK